MASTTFQNGVTLTDEDWFNDVDFLVYDIFGDSTTTASAAARLAGAFGNVTVGGTLSVSAQAVTNALQVGGVLSVSAQAVTNALQVGGVLSTSATAAMQGVQVGGTLSVSAGVAGAAIATQANMESAASAGSTSLIVTPGRVQYHPGVAKGWVRFDGTATSVTSGAAYNVTSITDNGTGNYTVFWSTPFSSATYAPVAGASLNNLRIASVSSNSVQLITLDLSGTAADASIVTLIAFGDQ